MLIGSRSRCSAIGPTLFLNLARSLASRAVAQQKNPPTYKKPSSLIGLEECRSLQDSPPTSLALRPLGKSSFTQSSAGRLEIQLFSGGGFRLPQIRTWPPEDPVGALGFERPIFNFTPPRHLSSQLLLLLPSNNSASFQTSVRPMASTTAPPRRTNPPLKRRFLMEVGHWTCGPSITSLQPLRKSFRLAGPG